MPFRWRNSSTLRAGTSGCSPFHSLASDCPGPTSSTAVTPCVFCAVSAVTTLAPGVMPGTARVTARAGEAVGEVDVSILPGPAAEVAVTAEPAELVANFNEVTRLTALVRDRYGNVVADGTVIRFETTVGQLISSSAPTVGGLAQVLMLGGRVAGTAVVTATAPSGVYGTVAVVIRPNRPAAVGLTAEPAAVVVGGVAALLTATVRDMFGNLVTEAVSVTFRTNLGGLRAVGSQQAVDSVYVGTAVDGVAVAELVSGERSGVAEVQVALNAAVSTVGQVRFLPGPAAQLTLSADPARVPVGGRTQLSAWVIDRFGNNVADGTWVSFGVTAGQLDASMVATRNGVASTGLTAPDQPGTVQVAAISSPASGFTAVEVFLSRATFLPLILR